MTPSQTSVAAIYQAVGARIRSERVERNLTQDELAAAVHLKRTSITNIEKGRQKILLHTLLELAAALGVPAGKLLGSNPAVGELDSMTNVPPHLSDSVKEWIRFGVATARARTEP